MKRYKDWALAASIRAAKTFGQVAGATIMLGEPVTGVVGVSWGGVFSIGALASILSLLTSLAGLPEVEKPSSGV